MSQKHLNLHVLDIFNQFLSENPRFTIKLVFDPHDSYSDAYSTLKFVELNDGIVIYNFFDIASHTEDMIIVGFSILSDDKEQYKAKCEFSCTSGMDIPLAFEYNISITNVNSKSTNTISSQNNNDINRRSDAVAKLIMESLPD